MRSLDFNTATVESAKGCPYYWMLDGNELIDFAGGYRMSQCRSIVPEAR